jgi:hypothetical protein
MHYLNSSSPLHAFINDYTQSPKHHRSSSP